MAIHCYPLANEVAKGYINATVRPSFRNILHIRILQWTKFRELLINHVGEFAMTKCILNCLKNYEDVHISTIFRSIEFF
jgi:hypothetical protein